MFRPSEPALEVRCAADGTACPDVILRLKASEAADAAGYPLEADQLRERARHFRWVHVEELRGHQTEWGLAK